MVSPALTVPDFPNFARWAPTYNVPLDPTRRNWFPLMLPTVCVTVPLTGAAAPGPLLAIMSLPWWKPVSERAKPQSFMNRAPGTGHRARAATGGVLRDDR